MRVCRNLSISEKPHQPHGDHGDAQGKWRDTGHKTSKKAEGSMKPKPGSYEAHKRARPRGPKSE